METGLNNYTDFLVRPVYHIKKAYGFRIVLRYEDGRTITQQRSGFDTEKDADLERCKTISELANHTYLVYGNVLVNEYFNHWLEDDIRIRTQNYNTYYTYRGIIKNHIVPCIGNKRMCALNTADITRLYQNAFQKSENIAKQVRVVTNSCLKYAVNERAIASNVASNVSLPKGVTKSPYHSRTINADKTLDHDQIMALIEGSKETPIHLMILFNVILGLRCSEIIALKYSDVDFMRQKLYVRRQLGRDINVSREDAQPKMFTKQEIKLKTRSSERELYIPNIVFEAILQEKKRYEANKRRRKNSFQDLGYICCSSYGRPRGKSFHFQHYKKLLSDLGLPDIRWHDLRSTAATVLLKAGFNAKAVSKVMGHSSEILTVDYYGDNRKMTVMKLDRLEDYIEEVKPVPRNAEGKENDYSDIKIDVTRYLK